MILIASGAIISREFQAEFGPLPPAFLPLGNKRLFEHQAQRLRQAFPGESLYMSLPEKFEIQRHDQLLLDKWQIVQVKVPNDISLGASVLHVINTLGVYEGCLRHLHGDTLLINFPDGKDLIGLGYVADDYSWEIEDTNQAQIAAWCGYFSFSDIKKLATSLALKKGSFIDAVRHYRSVQPMQSHMSTDWVDLGHINTFYRSRGAFTTERPFNQLQISDGVVRKSGNHKLKIFAEGYWFQKLPRKLKKYVPQVIDFGHEDGEVYYELEHLPYPSLAELYVFGALPLAHWKKIFHLANQLLGEFATEIHLNPETRQQIRQDFNWLVHAKTCERLKAYQETSGRAMHVVHELNGQQLPCLNDILTHCQRAIEEQDELHGVSHGDFCFGNILYDARQDRLKLIDPRGLAGAKGKATVLGDLRYDIAKLSHSAVGLYDHIVTGRYILHIKGLYKFEFTVDVDCKTEAITKNFLNFRFQGRFVVDTLPLVVLLFLSMLPLHEDDARRQTALYVNALRIYALWQKI